MNRGLLVGTLCYLFASVSWGLNVPLTSILFHTFDPFFLAFVRVLIATVVLAAIVWYAGGPGELRLPIDRRRHLILSLLLAGFFLLYNLGLRYTHPITAVAIMAATPVYAVVTLRVFARVPYEPGFWVAALLTVLGTGLAIYDRGGPVGQGVHLQGGELLIVLSYAFWNLYSICAQRWFSPAVTQIRRTYAVMSGAVVWMLLGWLAVWGAGLVPAPNLHPPPAAIVWLLVTAVLSSCLSLVAWNIGVSRIGLAVGSLWQNTVPVFAVLTSMLFGIVPGPGQAFGGLLVMAGVLYMQWRKSQAMAPPASVEAS